MRRTSVCHSKPCRRRNSLPPRMLNSRGPQRAAPFGGQRDDSRGPAAPHGRQGSPDAQALRDCRRGNKYPRLQLSEVSWFTAKMSRSKGLSFWKAVRPFALANFSKVPIKSLFFKDYSGICITGKRLSRRPGPKRTGRKIQGHVPSPAATSGRFPAACAAFHRGSKTYETIFAGIQILCPAGQRV